jgi:hypothetical protein
MDTTQSTPVCAPGAVPTCAPSKFLPESLFRDLFLPMLEAVGLVTILLGLFIVYGELASSDVPLTEPGVAADVFVLTKLLDLIAGRSILFTEGKVLV